VFFFPVFIRYDAELGTDRVVWRGADSWRYRHHSGACYWWWWWWWWTTL